MKPVRMDRKRVAEQRAIEEKLVPPAAIVVLSRLLHHHNLKTGRCYPSIATLADAIGLSERQIRKYIRDLERVGYVQTLPHKGPNRCNLYNLVILTGSTVSIEPAGLRALKRKQASENLRGSKEGIVRPTPAALAAAQMASVHIEDPKKRQELEAEVVKRLGGNQEAWSVLQKLPDGFLEDLTRDYETSSETLAGAATMAVERVRTFMGL